MTTKTVLEIKRLAEEEHLCDAAIARRMELPYGAVRKYRIESGIPKQNGGKIHKTKRYIFYARKTTQFLCEGTVEECAKVLGLSMSSMYSVIYRVRKGTYKKYEVYEVEE